MIKLLQYIAALALVNVIVLLALRDSHVVYDSWEEIVVVILEFIVANAVTCLVVNFFRKEF